MLIIKSHALKPALNSRDVKALCRLRRPRTVRCAIDEALRCKKEGKKETILFNLSGHGHFDMQAYINYFEGKLVDQNYDEKELAMALAGLPSVAA